MARGPGKMATRSQQGEQHPNTAVGYAVWKGYTGGTWTCHGTGGTTPSVPAGEPEDSCSHPSLGSPRRSSGTRPATSSRHIPQTTRFTVWPLLNFKQQLWLWDGASLCRGHHMSMARVLGWSVPCRRAVHVQQAFKGVEGAPSICTKPNLSSPVRRKAAARRKAIWHPLVWCSEKSLSVPRPSPYLSFPHNHTGCPCPQAHFSSAPL